MCASFTVNGNVLSEEPPGQEGSDVSAQVPEPVSPRYRSRVRKVSCSYRSQSVA